MTNRDYFSNRIVIPKFKVYYMGSKKKFVLNEYELTELMYRVANGDVDHHNLMVEDEDGNISEFDDSGVVEGNFKNGLSRYGIIANNHMKRVKVIRNKKQL